MFLLPDQNMMNIVAVMIRYEWPLKIDNDHTALEIENCCCIKIK
jgi:hypothetical protein